MTGWISASLGAQAVRVFLDERGLRPGRDLQALVGFDDDEIAFAAHPRLTTVRLPFYEIGRWGVDTLAALLEGQTPPAVTTLPASLVIRQSCGCKTEASLPGFWPGIDTTETTAPAVRLPHERDRILRLLLMTSGIQNVPRFREDIEQMLDLFIAECCDSFERDLSAYIKKGALPLTYHGFRYVQVEGYPGDLTADRIEGRVVRSAAAVTDAVRESVHLVNTARAMHGEPPLLPKEGARFHFELPGSVQSFRVDGDAAVTIQNVEGHSRLRSVGRRCRWPRASRATSPGRSPRWMVCPSSAWASSAKEAVRSISTR